jgi:hypothetical protein
MSMAFQIKWLEAYGRLALNLDSEDFKVPHEFQENSVRDV